MQEKDPKFEELLAMARLARNELEGIKFKPVKERNLHERPPTIEEQLMTKPPRDKEESAKELEERAKELQQIMIEDLAHADLESIIKSLYALRKFSMAGKHSRATLLGKTYKDISLYKDALHFEIQKRLKDNPDSEKIKQQIARDLSVYL